MEILSYSFDFNCKFAFKKCKFEYEGLEFVFYCGDENNCEVIQVSNKDENERDKIFRILNKFLNSFGWANHCSYEYKGYCAFGLAREIDLLEIGPRFFVPRNFRNQLVGFESTARVPTEELEKALSLYNEGNFTNNIFYKFFCYWKILDLKYPNRSTNDASEFINSIISFSKISIDNYIKNLLSQGKDVGQHLYKNLRCAIAHITRNPVRISYIASDYREVASACNSLIPFVDFFIKNELKIPVYSEKISIIKIIK